MELELDRLTQERVIEPIQFSDWAAPIVPVLKSDGESIRICGDFKVTINQVSKLDQYPIPKIEDLFTKLAGGKTFTKLDMSQAYQQLVLDKESRKYVVINTHRGLFRYNRLPFGVSSAPGIFQRTMENLLQGIPGVVVYIDDVLVTGKSEEEHLAALEETLRRLKEAGLRLKKSKCVFMASSVIYLGYRIDAESLHPVPEKVQALKEAPMPCNVSELKSYLGLPTYYSKFLPNVSTVVAPLYTNCYDTIASGSGHPNGREPSHSRRNYSCLLSSWFISIQVWKSVWHVMPQLMVSGQSCPIECQMGQKSQLPLRHEL